MSKAVIIFWRRKRRCIFCAPQRHPPCEVLKFGAAHPDLTCRALAAHVRGNGPQVMPRLWSATRSAGHEHRISKVRSCYSRAPHQMHRQILIQNLGNSRRSLQYKFRCNPSAGHRKSGIRAADGQRLGGQTMPRRGPRGGGGGGYTSLNIIAPFPQTASKMASGCRKREIRLPV